MSRPSTRPHPGPPWFLFLLLVATLATPLHARATNGWVHGKVRYADGSDAAFVTVFLESETTTWNESTISEDDGSFLFRPVPVGQYKLYAFEAGMVSTSVQGLSVVASTGTSSDITLTEADEPAEETLEVSACLMSPVNTRTSGSTTGPRFRLNGMSQHARPQPLGRPERYSRPPETDFRDSTRRPRSTFSIDVDTASYSNVRRFLRDGALPPPEAVRLEEIVNYFSYDPLDRAAFGEHQVAVGSEIASCPWAPERRLLRITVQGKGLDRDQSLPPRNLVLLIDVSGSMNETDKLPLVKSGLRHLVDQLRPVDRLGIVTYSDEARVALRSTSGSDRETLRRVIDGLTASGSTNGSAGLELAYSLATEHRREGDISRVILATDGDFNVGLQTRRDLVKLAERVRRTGVDLTVLGFGRGNLQDEWLEQVADNGNGNYAYVDGLAEAHRALVAEAAATQLTVAKDVKLQVELNPAEVASYRLLGYENRALADADFRKDDKDAGELGAGQLVTALYEIVPTQRGDVAGAEPLRYVERPSLTSAALSGELATVHVRYKNPGEKKSRKLSATVRDDGGSFEDASNDFRFATAAAGHALLLQRTKLTPELDWALVQAIARDALGTKNAAERTELVDLARRAGELSGGRQDG
ncbi:MAG: von Willebrand factor type A domain-containing protein [Acidobacteriota bacterium]